MLPVACLAIRARASRSTLISSWEAIFSRRSAMVDRGIRRKSNLWHRERMVAGSFCGSVVARIKIACGGGSSRVLSKALKAAFESIWTSSITYTF